MRVFRLAQVVLVGLVLGRDPGLAWGQPGTGPVHPRAGQPDFGPMGFAHVGHPTTGGGSVEPVPVRTVEELVSLAGSDRPKVLRLQGRFDLAGRSVRVGSNTTVVGAGTGAVLVGGGLHIREATNVIVRNLVIRGSPGDGISLAGARRVWIDHCTILDCADGLVDLTHGTDEVTLSWCRFGYEDLRNSHRLASLLGASDRDLACQGRLHVTYHHNWWDEGCLERMPSVRFGRVHLFNNYYRAPGNRYCIRSRLYAEVRVEFNWFEQVRNPWEVYVTRGDLGRVWAVGNVEVNTQWEGSGRDVRLVAGTDPVFVPPYPWRPHAPELVPLWVREHAGAGRGPFAP